MTDQSEKAAAFREAHVPGDPLLMPNADSAGAAKMLAAMGAKAIGTTSAGAAFMLGMGDGAQMTRDQMLDHCEDLARAVAIPVSGDLENGYAHDPDGVAETIELAGEVGLVGASIEDTTFERGDPCYPFDIAVDRIRAAVEAAERHPFPFTLCARADGVMNGFYDVDEAIRRCEAFAEAGAHLVYAPLLPTLEDQARLIDTVGTTPVNVLVSGSRMIMHSRTEFAAIGAARLSIGGALSRVAHRAILEIGHAMIDEGDFTGLGRSVSSNEIDRLLAEGSA